MSCIPYEKASEKSDQFHAEFQLDSQKAADNGRERAGHAEPRVEPHRIGVANVEAVVGSQIGDYVGRHVAECVRRGERDVNENASQESRIFSKFTWQKQVYDAHFFSFLQIKICILFNSYIICFQTFSNLTL